jgi:hypothetical protein
MFKRLWITLAANEVLSPTRSMKHSKRVSPIPTPGHNRVFQLPAKNLEISQLDKAGLPKVQQSIAPQVHRQGLAAMLSQAAYVHAAIIG